jgi:hypothetical protein
MKNTQGLGINTAVSQPFHFGLSRTFTYSVQIAKIDKKYLGDPESPNFLPDSPLIDRPVLSSRQETELKLICRLLLADVKNSDDNGTDPLSEIIQSLQAREALPLQGAPRHKVQISGRAASKPVASSRNNTAKRNEVRPRNDREDAGAFNILSKPAFTESPTAQPLSAHSNDEALWAIRSKMSSRPKTSAAACIDYTGEHTDPSSRPSNRTTYTTFSTPATSIGFPTSGGKKSFTHDGPAMPMVDLYNLLSQGDSPSRDNAQVRAWMEEQYEHRHLNGPNSHDYSTNSLREFYSTSRPEEVEQARSGGKRNSIRTNIQEYFRPASSASNLARQSSIASIKKYIRPGSSAGSVRSVTTNVSTRSKTQDHWSSIKRKLSNASQISQRNNRKDSKAVDKDQHVQHEGGIDLNRPLPPLPGLDSYRERPTHIASLMKTNPKPKTDPTPAENTSAEHFIKPDKPIERPSNHSIPISSKNMSTASLRSTPMSPNAVSMAHKRSSSLERLQSRPHAAKAGISAAVSPLSQSTVPKADSKKEGFAKRWGGKLSRSKKPKAVAAV